jgi:hypothetical protein
LFKKAGQIKSRCALREEAQKSVFVSLLRLVGWQEVWNFEASVPLGIKSCFLVFGLWFGVLGLEGRGDVLWGFKVVFLFRFLVGSLEIRLWWFFIWNLAGFVGTFEVFKLWLSQRQISCNLTKLTARINFLLFSRIHLIFGYCIPSFYRTLRKYQFAHR